MDGLRAVAIVPVLLFHAGVAWISGGFVGVDVFFVISGYLITSLIVAEKETGRFSLVGFYERRARRILPALFLVMLACVIPAWFWMTPQALQAFGESLVAVSAFANNILLALTSGYFDPSVEEKPLLHTWTLAVEEQYYVFFPLLLMLCWRLGRRWIIALAAAAALLSLAYAEWGWRHRPESSFYLVQFRAWELLLGVLVAFTRQNVVAALRGSPLLANAIGALGLGLIAIAVFGFDENTPFPSVYALVPTVGTVLVLYAAAPGNLAGKLLGSTAFVGIGLISYSLYLWHQPLLAYARLTSDEEPPQWLLLSLIALTFLLSWLGWRFVETPVRDRRRFSRTAVFSMALFGSLTFIGLGLAAHFSHGFVWRMSPRYVSELQAFHDESESRRKWLKSTCFFSEQALREVPALAADWGCRTQPQRARVLVVGDSHAADKAMALRLNGIVVDEMTGPDCSLAPSAMRYMCRERFDAVLDNDIQRNYDLVILAHRWKNTDDIAAFSREIAYWSRLGPHVALAGPAPEFGKFADRVAYLVGQGMTREQAATRARLEEHRLASTDAALRAVADRNHFRYFATGAAFCSLSGMPGCVPFADGQYLIIDYAHLSSTGAELLGRAMVKSLGLQRLQSEAVGTP